ncbi:MAG: transporter substrate-binding domain-containing protein [Deltaproteobacteria bacterium]|nr:transporter substrate-binding domain-containing protein [Deltaproteobacteria bacterium]
MNVKSIMTWVAVITVVIAAMNMTSCDSNPQPEEVKESMIEQALKRGVLKVGMSTFVPWAMKDKKGRLIGFEIDVATRLAHDMGVDVDFIPTKWAGIIPALQTGKFDVIIGGMGIRPERNIKVNFSIPYDTTGMDIIAHRELAKGFNSLKDFNKPDVVIAARLGSTAVTAAKKYMPNAQLRLFDDESQAYQELVNGNAHAVVGSAPRPAYEALKYSERLFLPLTGTFTREPIGFAVRKGDPDTLNFLDNWIRVTEAEGWLQERKHYWFETREWEHLLQ